MATVYLAHDVRHDRKVALKVLRPELSAILGGERFLHEIKTTANLQHPHILGLFDSGIVGSGDRGTEFLYYVMPYVEGESLRDRLSREKQLPVNEAVRIAREVADALQYAHEQGIVHRDIKPENILLHGGHAMVADFGIALAASRSDGGSRMTETGMSLGTPHYMSPEQAMGEREITPRADIYALGCVLYEMLTAEPPFTGATAQAIIARVMTEEPRSLTLQRRTIPPHVEAAVRTALEKLPADRFATAGAFAEALGRSDYEVPALGTAAAAGQRSFGPPIRRSVALVPWAVALVAAGVAAWGWLRPAPQPPVARQRVALWDSPVAAGTIGQDLAIAPSGGAIVYVDSVGGQRQLWLKERDRATATPLTGTAGATAPAFSPDGLWIAFVADGVVRKVPRQGGSAITIADSATLRLSSVAWLDGGTILYTDREFGLRAVAEDGGPTRQLTSMGLATAGRGVASITGLPGGRGALFAVCSFNCPDPDLHVLDITTGEDTILITGVLKAWVVSGERVVLVRQDGGVFVAPFDRDRRVFRSPPVPVLDGVRTNSGRADLALSADGTLLYAAGGAAGAPEVQAVWVDRTGRVAPVDSGWRFARAPNDGMALSPDGRRLAVSIRAGNSDDLWVKELDRGPLTRLTFGGSNIRPVWTADSRSVLYVEDRTPRSRLMRRAADGTGGADSALTLSRPIWEAIPTRDSLQVVVRLGSPPTRDIYLYRRGERDTLVPLVASDRAEETTPALSPDGRWLAYASNESGRYEVYVRPFPNVEAGRWQVSSGGGGEPQWSPTGRELFYRDGSSLVSATLLPGASFALGPQVRLFPVAEFASSPSTRLYQVGPDARRFLFLRMISAAPGVGTRTLVLVTNWLAELDASPRGGR
jgi:Tol biopolymer transport system component